MSQNKSRTQKTAAGSEEGLVGERGEGVGEGGSEALGQLGQDEPASGIALEPLVAFAPRLRGGTHCRVFSRQVGRLISNGLQEAGSRI